MPTETLLFQKREDDLAVEVRSVNGHRSIELLRRYEKDGEWRATNRLGYANHRKGTQLLRDAQKWIDEQDQAEGKKRETERQKKEPKDWTRGMIFGQRIREKRKAAGHDTDRRSLTSNQGTVLAPHTCMRQRMAGRPYPPAGYRPVLFHPARHSTPHTLSARVEFSHSLQPPHVIPDVCFKVRRGSTHPLSF
jgi:hypothetical protein